MNSTDNEFPEPKGGVEFVKNCSVNWKKPESDQSLSHLGASQQEARTSARPNLFFCVRLGYKISVSYGESPNEMKNF